MAGTVGCNHHGAPPRAAAACLLPAKLPVGFVGVREARSGSSGLQGWILPCSIAFPSWEEKIGVKSGCGCL